MRMTVCVATPTARVLVLLASVASYVTNVGILLLIYLYLSLSFIMSLVCMTSSFNNYLNYCILYFVNTLEQSFFSGNGVKIKFIIIISLSPYSCNINMIYSLSENVIDPLIQ